MGETKIEWTDATWNPTTGCTRASAGCDNCYAFTMTKRLAAMGQKKYQGLAGNGHFNGVLKTWDDELAKPLHWKKPRRVFVNSMSDLFHKDVPFEFVDKVFAVMALTPHCTYQILTKRPERMAEYLTDVPSRILAVIDAMAGFVGRNAPFRGMGFTTHFNDTENLLPAANVWLGTSVENQAAADERIPHLLDCQAAVRFLSCEPLLGPIDLDGGGYLWGGCDDCDVEISPIDWVIVGGESGPGARPCEIHSIRSIVEQCKTAGVPCFVKQLGSNCVVDRNIELRGCPHCLLRKKLKDKKGGDINEFPEDLRVREFPQPAARCGEKVRRGDEQRT